MIGEMLMSSYDEKSVSHCEPVKTTDGCALATVGIGSNNIVEMTVPINEAVETEGTDHVSAAALLHNKFN